MPFGSIYAREPIARVFGYVGFIDEVIPILQVMSHKTRAFICNPSANFLQGFLYKKEIIKILKRADACKQLEVVKRWQIFDLP